MNRFDLWQQANDRRLAAHAIRPHDTLLSYSLRSDQRIKAAVAATVALNDWLGEALCGGTARRDVG